MPCHLAGLCLQMAWRISCIVLPQVGSSIRVNIPFENFEEPRPLRFQDLMVVDLVSAQSVFSMLALDERQGEPWWDVALLLPLGRTVSERYLLSHVIVR